MDLNVLSALHHYHTSVCQTMVGITIAKYKEFCAIGNYCGSELCILICSHRECNSNFFENVVANEHYKWRACK